jgi:GntR family transcriptional regulator
MAKAGYTDIAAHFRTLIADGTLAPGDSLPSMREVSEQFNVAITTVNRAYSLLKREGLTRAEAGNRTAVAEPGPFAATGAARIDRLTKTGKHYAPGETSTGHTAMVRSCADPRIADELGIELHDEIVIRRRVFRRNGVPTVSALSCIHIRALANVPELLQEGELRPFWQHTYTERTGKQVTRSPEVRSARIASADELEALEVEAPPEAAVPVLVLHTTFHTEDGPLEVWEDVYAPGLRQVAAE